jgi:hypothetical protein
LKKGSSGGRRDDADDEDANIGDFLVVEGNSNQEDAKSYSLEAKSEVLNQIIDKYMDYVVLQEDQTTLKPGKSWRLWYMAVWG